MKLRIGKEEFIAERLIDKRIDDPEVQRFIDVIKKFDDSYIVHEPMSEDIILPQDNWASHEAEKVGICIEFICDEICYFTFRTDNLDLSSEEMNTEVVIRVFEWRDAKYKTFISTQKIKDNLLPNRWIPGIS